VDREEELLKQAVMRLNVKLLGTVFGLVLGFGLFLATNILIIKGGPVVGPHLALLNQFFPGYRVSFLGSLIGFIYGFGTGFLMGALLGVVYNQIAPG
jgi:hypothetical protein